MAGTGRVTGVVLAVAVLASTAPVSEGVRLRLPPPTGRAGVGTTALHLVDADRDDPLAPTARHRELVVRLWYPASGSGRLAGYLPRRQGAALVEHLNAVSGTDYPTDLLTFPTHSRVSAPVTGTRLPVVLLSPGSGELAAFHTGTAEELASRGYVVAGVDHTFDAPAVEFPGGRVEPRHDSALTDRARLRAVRVADLRFVLDQLAVLAGGRNPDAGHRRLPTGLGRGLDLTRVAAMGHSSGSTAVVGAMAADRRIDAGVALDGNPLGRAGLDRPFLMLGNQGHGRADDPDWAAFYDRLLGPRLHLVVHGAEHHDLTDATVFKKDVNLSAVSVFGTIDGARALTVKRVYVTAWLDSALLGRRNPVLAGESRDFPEVDFQP